jgi:hypothetical protein
MTMSHVAAPAGSANPQRLLRNTPRPRPLAIWEGVRAVLRGRRGLFLGALVAGLGIFAGWLWLGAAAVLPLLYSLPCAAMMLMCMKGHGTSTTEREANPGEAEGNPDPGVSQ